LLPYEYLQGKPMALIESQQIPLDTEAKPFSLRNVDGETISLESFQSCAGLVILFTCNHCPYAIAIEERFINLANEYLDKGFGFAAIMSNDVDRYPKEHPDRMLERAQEMNYPFPYLYDEKQETAKSYGAVCTPDFFVFDGTMNLAYRGRLDNNWKHPDQVTHQDLKLALEAILDGESPSPDQHPSMGCSIKWK